MFAITSIIDSFLYKLKEIDFTHQDIPDSFLDEKKVAHFQ
jgi:hypothetical protein